MRLSRLLLIDRSLHLNTVPLLDPVWDPVDVGVFVNLQPAQFLTLLAPLAVYNSVVSVIWVLSDQRRNLSAEPNTARAGFAVASEASKDECRVGTGRPFATIIVVELSSDGVFAESYRDVLMQRHVHPGAGRRWLWFEGFLFAHSWKVS